VQSYRDKDRLIDFIGFLQYRGCHSPHIIKHLDIARRMWEFLDTCEGERQRSQKRKHLDEQWFSNIVIDVKRLTARTRPLADPLPSAAVVFKFVKTLLDEAKTSIATEMKKKKRLKRKGGSIDTAQRVQKAIIAMMVCGTHTPPSRLSALKTAQHPSKIANSCPHAGCHDPMCRGNRFEVIELGDAGGRWQESKDALREGDWEDAEEEFEELLDTPSLDAIPAAAVAVAASAPVHRQVAYRVPHHKNTLRGFSGIQYVFPQGDLTDLLVYHIDNGSRLLVKQPAISLFANANQGPFTDGTFTRYWQEKVLAGAPFPIFPPSKGRDIFVAEFVNTGSSNLQEGAATVRSRRFETNNIDRGS